MVNGFKFNNQHSNEFEIIMEYYVVKTPEKKKVLVEVPHRSGTLDFSHIYTGENIFSDREIEVKFSVVKKRLVDLRVIYNRLILWLIDTEGKCKLQFDDAKGYYFMAEVINSIDYEEFYETGTFTVIFSASPFRSSNTYQGNYLLWDDFNFLEDVLQKTDFVIESGTEDIVIVNKGKRITPIIKVHKGSVRITRDSYTTPSLGVGEHKDFNLFLKKGENSLRIQASGKSRVEFLFRKETI